MICLTLMMVLVVTLIAISRKVIILNIEKYESLTLVGIAALIAAVSLAFLVVKRHIYKPVRDEDE